VRWLRKIRLSATAAGIACIVPLAVAAATPTTYTDSISGTELPGATSTQGSFAGTASGPLPGAWTATIDHTVLSPNAIISGGTFSLATAFNGQLAQVTGDFANGGTVTLEWQAWGCGNQVYAVSDSLNDVAVRSLTRTVASSGVDSFAATLTHYRTSIFGFCVTYAATVRGDVSLTF